jgi:16S rRNA processing protein RimM
MAARKASSKVESGSLKDGEPAYLIVGRLQRPHGVHGEILMQVHTDFPERLKPKTQVYVGDSHEPLTIAATRFHNEGLLIRFEGMRGPDDVGRRRNQWVYVTAADRPKLPQGRFYHHELIGFAVVNEDGEPIGTLADILQTGANDVYAVKRLDASEILLPAIPSVIRDIEPARRQIRVHLLPGLLDESED